MPSDVPSQTARQDLSKSMKIILFCAKKVMLLALGITAICQQMVKTDLYVHIIAIATIRITLNLVWYACAKQNLKKEILTS